MKYSQEEDEISARAPRKRNHFSGPALDSPTEVEVGLVPLELEEVEPGAEASPKGDKGSCELKEVEVTTAEVELRIPDEPGAVESPEGREAPRTRRDELVNF